MIRIYSLLIFLSITFLSFGQAGNNNPGAGAIQFSMPKTPESQAFEKYGNIPLNEYSGTPNISIPLYTVKSKFLEVPLTITYDASGIKVSQEATYTGLGFNLVCGGRITVDVKGNVDGITYNENPVFREGVRRLFTKWRKPYGPYQNVANNNPKIGYAYLDYGAVGNHTDPYCHPNDTLWDDPYTVSRAAWAGAGEPDLYNANFLGKSVTFYRDLITGGTEMKGEKQHYFIDIIKQNNAITSIRIVDENAIEYTFGQKEETYSQMPVFNSNLSSSNQSGTAWLLTKIQKQDDIINFTYTNYGTVNPAVTWSQSISGVMPYPVNDYGSGQQNALTQYPYYLTKVESNNTIVDFLFSTRDDLQGNGARKLDKIEVKEKVSSSLIKQYNFNYDYFTASAETGDNNLPDYKKKRLKLTSITQGANSDAPWKFYYNNIPGPNKYSFSQDHWGYFNGASNQNLVPVYTDLGNLVATRNLILYYIVNGYAMGMPNYNVENYNNLEIPLSFQGQAWGGRNCNATKILAYSMDSIVYPTGGATKFELEPHVSNYPGKQISNFVGGGLRVKSIKNYAIGNLLESKTEYDYQNSGIYLGAIEYLKAWTKTDPGNSISMSAWGSMVDGGQYVGYGSVKKTIKDFNNLASNGYEIKYFKVSPPLYEEQVYAPSPYAPCHNTGGSTYCLPSGDTRFMYLQWPKNEPTQKEDLDGKLYKEEFYNASDVKVKSTEYYYRQSNFKNDFYSMRVEDNYNGYITQLTENQGVGFGAGDGTPGMNWRRWTVCLYPGPSYFTVLDSVVDKTLSDNGNFITTKKAYKYNSYHQPEFTTTYNSDGTQSIAYLKTPVSFSHPQIPSAGEADAYEIEQMRNGHLWNVPIEQVSIQRSINGDSLVTAAIYTAYEAQNLKKVYKLQTASPLIFRSQFIPTYYLHNYPTLPSFNVAKDSKYKLEESAEYTTANFIKDITTAKEKKAIVWDEQNNTVLAGCTNAISNDIAFTSFETAAKGNWSYTGAGSPEPGCPTGNNAYSLTNGAISKAGLSPSKNYTVSYWSNSGAQNVNGASSISGRSYGLFTYYEHRVQNPAGGNITVSGTGMIDELRVYPENSFMTTYTYKPLVGISSQADQRSVINYYEYDQMGRLALIRDMDNNILKKICYNFAGQPENCVTCTNFTPNWQNTTQLRCIQGPCGNTGYQEQEQRDLNTCSPSYDSIRWINVGYNATACPLGTCVNLTSTNTYNTQGYVAVYLNTATNVTYTFNVSTASGLQPLGTVPEGNYTLTISRPVLGNVYSIFKSGCWKQTITDYSAIFYNVAVSTATCNSITTTMNMEY